MPPLVWPPSMGISAPVMNARLVGHQEHHELGHLLGLAAAAQRGQRLVGGQERGGAEAVIGVWM